MYLDQAGVDDILDWPYGWRPKGKRCPAQRLGHRTRRVSIAAAWCCGEALAPLTFEGYCHSELVVAWFEQQLCPALRPGQVVILDNASFHPMKILSALVEAVGCTLLPLPRYSPDLNKIEHLWPQLKTRIALDNNPYPSFRLQVDAALIEPLLLEARYQIPIRETGRNPPPREGYPAKPIPTSPPAPPRDKK